MPDSDGWRRARCSKWSRWHNYTAEYLLKCQLDRQKLASDRIGSDPMRPSVAAVSVRLGTAVRWRGGVRSRPAWTAMLLRSDRRVSSDCSDRIGVPVRTEEECDCVTHVTHPICIPDTGNIIAGKTRPRGQLAPIGAGLDTSQYKQRHEQKVGAQQNFSHSNCHHPEIRISLVTYNRLFSSNLQPGFTFRTS
jgi:hypothetical protein